MAMTYTVLSLATVELTDDQFYRLCTVNQALQLERTAREELIFHLP